MLRDVKHEEKHRRRSNLIHVSTAEYTPNKIYQKASNLRDMIQFN